MGRIVTLITASPPDELFAKFWPHLLGMAGVLLIARPIALTTQNLIANQAISANMSNRIRWQNHWYVVRQSWAFFQNDFAGRIANRVMQTGPAIRETLVALLTSVWYILVYGTSALILLASADPVLALPIALWFLGYLLMLRVLVPRMRDRSKAVSEGRSLLTGRIVDSYTNILTVKLFARAREEDAYVRDAIDHHTKLFYRSLRLNTLFGFCLSSLNALMVTGTSALDRPFRRRQVDGGQSAAALLRPRRRPYPDRRPGHRRGHAGEPARANLRGHAGHLAAAPLDPRQHPLRPAAGDRRRDRDRGEARPRRRVHRRTRGLEAAARLCRASRRARREALRRAAPARRHRARDPQGRADPGARRGHLRARQRGRGRDSIEPGHADGRQDRDRHRAPALDHRAHGPADRARARPHRRAGLA